MAQVLIPVDDQQQLDRHVWTALVRFRAGYACEKCNRRECRLHAHHKNEDDTDNRLANGEALCVRCHGKRHPNWRSRTYTRTCECGRCRKCKNREAMRRHRERKKTEAR